MNEFCPTVLEKRFMQILIPKVLRLFAKFLRNTVCEKYIRESFAYGEIMQKIYFFLRK